MLEIVNSGVVQERRPSFILSGFPSLAGRQPVPVSVCLCRCCRVVASITVSPPGEARVVGPQNQVGL